MSMNRIGKILVVFNTAASLLALGWAIGIYFQFTDFGWKEPRKELDVRIPSEYDKRAAAAVVLIKARDMVLPATLPAHAGLRDAQYSFGVNHLDYVRDLDELRNAPGDIEVKEIKYNKGKLELDSKGRPTGKPVQAEKVPGLTKSYAGYMRELSEKMEACGKLTEEAGKEIEKAKEVTDNLTDKVNADEVVAPGLFTLLNEEKAAQDRILAEMDYIRPRWARAREEAELFRNREVSLQKRLDELLKQK